jgi:Xaa-Pro aminopeptidase
MAIKSKEEIAQMTTTYNLVARAMDLVENALEPRKTEREVLAEAICYLGAHECYDGIAHVGHHAAPNIRPAGERVIEEDDIIKVSLEWAGPSGHWIELSGVFSFKEPSERMKHYYDTMHKAVYHAISLMKPGAVAGQVSRAAWRVFQDEGFNITDRVIWDFHGIGINVISAPFGLPDSQDVFKENMVINIHPGPVIDDDKWGVYIQENVVVTPQGGKVLGEYTHKWCVLSSPEAEQERGGNDG